MATVAVGVPHTVALAGEPAPADLGGRYGHIVAASAGDAGAVALAVRLTGAVCAAALLLRSRGSFSVPGRDPALGEQARGSFSVLARVGDPAPGGGRYGSFRAVDVTAGPTVFFAAGLAGGEAVEGLFVHDGVNTRVVALAGDAAPHGGRYVSFRRLSCHPASGFAFTALLDDGRTVVVQQRPDGHTGVLLASGTPLAGGVVETIDASPLGQAVCCLVTLRSDSDRSAAAVVAHESLVTCGDWLSEGGRVPGLGTVRRLIGPPAINSQLGFVPVELVDGGAALCSRPLAYADPTVLARTGDPVDDDAIASFGPAVANITGDGFTVASFRPVKLTDDGTLLLSVRLEHDGRRRTALLVLPGLLDG